MGIILSTINNIIAHLMFSEGHKTKAIVYVRKLIPESETISNAIIISYLESLKDVLGEMNLKIAKIIGDTFENLNSTIAQQVIGFSIREIPEPSGYIAVIYEGLSSMVAAYLCVEDKELILYKKEDIFYAGKYFRFKEEVNIECDKVLML